MKEIKDNPKHEGKRKGRERQDGDIKAELNARQKQRCVKEGRTDVGGAEGRQVSREGERREEAAWSGFSALLCGPGATGGPVVTAQPRAHPFATAHSPASINVQVL